MIPNSVDNLPRGCENCNCPTGGCRQYTRTDRVVCSNWNITVPPETEYERELRELAEGIAAAFLDRHLKTRAGWAHALRQRQKPAHRPPRIPKNFQRRPGRPSRHHGRGRSPVPYASDGV